MTHDEWMSKGKELFGDDIYKWKFVCPSCGHVISVQDYKDAGAPSSAVAFSCIGRWMKEDRSISTFTGKNGPCDYAGGGLIGLNPIEVDGQRYFDFYAEIK